jgi:hypothetical protein
VYALAAGGDSGPADLSGRWSTGGAEVFVLRQNGNTITGTTVGKPGEPAYKIVDGVIRGNQIRFFVLHEDENDPEVQANEGKPFHNLAQGTFTVDEIVVLGEGRIILIAPQGALRADLRVIVRRRPVDARVGVYVRVPE